MPTVEAPSLVEEKAGESYDQYSTMLPNSLKGASLTRLHRKEQSETDLCLELQTRQCEKGYFEKFICKLLIQRFVIWQSRESQIKVLSESVGKNVSVEVSEDSSELELRNERGGAVGT